MSVAFLSTCFSTANFRKGWQPIAGLTGWRLRHYVSEEDWRDWDDDFPQGGFWLSADFLRFIQAHPQGLQSGAVALWNAAYDRPILLSVQSFQLRLRDQLQGHAPTRSLLARLTRRIVSLLSPKVVVLGQLLTSGPFGSSGLDLLPADQAVNLLEAVGRFLNNQSSGYSAVVVKDLFPEGNDALAHLEQAGFVRVPVDPVMLMDVSRFDNLDDYLRSLSSKYRVRYRRARKKAEGLERRLLSPDEVERHLPRIYDLHRETRQGANFKFVALSEEYFGWLRHHAVIQGYFDQGELIGFTSAVINGPYYHAHYLGLREAYKYSHHLYHNMLYDLLEDALAEPVMVLDYGRTALEIKSSVGAQASDFPVVVRSNYSWVNRLLGPLIRAVHQPPDWRQRNPYK